MSSSPDSSPDEDDDDDDDDLAQPPTLDPNLPLGLSPTSNTSIDDLNGPRGTPATPHPPDLYLSIPLRLPAGCEGLR